jgi:hypothetical protein
MKIPYRLACAKCKTENIYFVCLSEVSVRVLCSKCGDRCTYGFDGFTLGEKLLYKSAYEYEKNKDYCLSIVLSAMAFEVDLYQLYYRWNAVDVGGCVKRPSDEDIVKAFRKFQTVNNKLNETSKMICYEGFKEFIYKSKDLNDAIQQGFPSLKEDIERGIQKELLWARNAILHNGKSDFGSGDAIKAFNISTLCLRIFRRIGESRIQKESANSILK